MNHITIDLLCSGDLRGKMKWIFSEITIGEVIGWYESTQLAFGTSSEPQPKYIPSGCKEMTMPVPQQDMLSNLLDTADMMMAIVVVPAIQSISYPWAVMHERSRG